jgi:hypothetical protein
LKLVSEMTVCHNALQCSQVATHQSSNAVLR